MGRKKGKKKLTKNNPAKKKIAAKKSMEQDTYKQNIFKSGEAKIKIKLLNNLLKRKNTI